MTAAGLALVAATAGVAMWVARDVDAPANATPSASQTSAVEARQLFAAGCDDRIAANQHAVVQDAFFRRMWNRSLAEFAAAASKDPAWIDGQRAALRLIPPPKPVGTTLYGGYDADGNYHFDRWHSDEYAEVQSSANSELVAACARAIS